MTLTDALSALGASNTDFTGGDAIWVRLALNLTDGRTLQILMLLVHYKVLTLVHLMHTMQ